MSARHPRVRHLPAAVGAAAALLLPASASAPPGTDGTITVRVASERPANTFVPDLALGAGVDGHEQGDTARMLTPANVRAMRSAGLRPLTYRLRTELGVEAWHWNPRGRWSEPGLRRGYWTSDDRSDRPIRVCYGYRLPRRGSTVDQANNDGYSRLDDGDTRTFWKSNPYLDTHFTGLPSRRHPQWFVVDFGHRVGINAIRVLWGEPYATEYRVQYCADPHAIDIEDQVPGSWVDFPRGRVAGGRGGSGQLRLAPRPIAARYFRVVMAAASGTAPTGSHDVRDRLGYAVREVYLGTLDGRGRFRDRMQHGLRAAAQTVTYASSTDPWHRASDIDRNVEQPGFDLVYRSGLTSGLPVLVPVPMLYDTPENAAAMLRFLRSRGYAVRGVEMGEEPDGQYVLPEDYAALYIRWADGLRRVDRAVPLGGPCFQTTIYGWTTWPQVRGGRSWMHRFLDYLRERGRLREFQFFTFEWYPFDNTRTATGPQLAAAPGLLRGALERLLREGLPASIPWMITEYGYSAFSGRPEVDIEGALFNVDAVCQFLTLGGDAAFLYGYEPNSLIEETPGAWGNNMILEADGAGRARYRLATYWAARLLTGAWSQPGHGAHAVYPAACDIRDRRGRPLVTAYAVRRPDRRWAIMVVNKDPERAHTVQLRFAGTRVRRTAALAGPVEVWRYSRKQYVWRAAGERGRPARSRSPERRLMTGGAALAVRLPAYSLTVVRGRLAQDPAGPAPN